MTELGSALESATFFSAQGEAAPREASSGVHGTVAVLIASVALLVGILTGLVIS